MSTLRKRKRPTWWTEDIQKLVNRRKKLRKKAERSDSDKARWRSACETAAAAIIDAKEQHWRSFTATLHYKEDSTKVWTGGLLGGWMVILTTHTKVKHCVRTAKR